MTTGQKSFIIIFSILVFLFLKASPLFDHVESGIYLAYTQSFIEDGDLNTVDQQLALGEISSDGYQTYKNGEKGILSPSLNSPTLWNHGGVILWAPFYAYSKALTKLVNFSPQQSALHPHLGLVLANIFLVLLALITMLKMSNYVLNDQSKSLALTTFFATPVFFYTIFEPGNANISAIFLAPLIIMKTLALIRAPGRLLDYMCLGLLIGMAAVIKIDAIFYTIVSAAIVLDSIIKTKKIIVKDLARFLIVAIFFCFPLLLQMANDYLKFDFITFGYLGVKTDNYNVFFDALFSAYKGHIFTSPIYALTAISGLFLIFKYFKTKNVTNLLVGLLIFIPLIKEYFATQTFVHGSGNFGARQYCVELPIVYLVLITAFKNLKSPTHQKLLKGGLVLSVVWTLFMFYFHFRPELFNVDQVSFEISFVKYLSSEYINWDLFLVLWKKVLLIFPAIKLKLYYLPVILVLSYVANLIYHFDVKSSKFFKAINILALILTVTYSLVTISNIFTNKSNALALKKEGFFKNMLIGRGSELYLYEENIASMEDKLIQVKDHDPTLYSKILNLRNTYHIKAVGQLLTLPKEEDNLRDYFPFPEHGYDPEISNTAIRMKIPTYDDRILFYRSDL